MKKLLTILFAVALGLNLSAQTACSNPQDANQDGVIGVDDLMDLLSHWCDTDLDFDGVYDSVDLCTDEGACNYLSNPTEACLYLDAIGACGGDCVEDTDGDGVCDPFYGPCQLEFSRFFLLWWFKTYEMKNFSHIPVWIYSILLYFFFGGMIFTMMTQYPNWDYNLPDSMVIRNQFYAKTNPGTFFQFFGPIINFVFLVMIILIWKMKKVRNLFLIQFFTFLVIGVGTGLLIYPILDELAIDTIPLEKIQNLLQKFKLLDTIRAFIAIISVILLTFSLINFNKSIYSKD